MRYDNGQADEAVDIYSSPTLASVDYPWVRKVPSGEPAIAQLDCLQELFREAHGQLDLMHIVPIHVRITAGKAFPSALTATVEFIARLAERWELSSQEMATLLGFESSDMVSDMLEGASVLRGRDAEDRVANLFRIYETVFGLFRDADAERKWIRQPVDSFRGRSCLDVMLGGSMEDLVDVRRVVEHIAGR